MKEYILPELPYAYDALEPYIDEKTMRVHHDGHHKTYVEKLNAALKKYPHWMKPVEELLESLRSLPPELQTQVRENGGGHANHSLFWTLLTPTGQKKPVGSVSRVIDETFGNFSNFKEKFTNIAVNHFSNGWTWLVADADRNLHLMATADHDSPLTEGMTPLLVVDVWEHAYYLKHQNKRPDFLEDFWHIVNWQEVSARWDEFENTGSTTREWKIA